VSSFPEVAVTENNTTSTLGPIAPFFIVSSLKSAVEFYKGKLGFELLYIGPEDDEFFAVFGRGKAEIHVKELGPDVPPQPNSSRHEDAPWDAFVTAFELDALVAEYSARGLDPRIEDRDDGLRGFTVRDDDGYTLFFGHLKR
jgi:catechol 2,3-dioxygenase-like lactoylglutathione lyase family enzyme